MFNNLINIDDVFELTRRVKNNPGLLRKIVGKMFGNSQEKVELAWSHSESIPDKWWFVPLIRQRWNYLITGDKEFHYSNYFIKKYLKQRNDYRAFSFACGNGTKEMLWVKSNKFSLLRGFDLSEKRIANAKNVALENDLSKKILFEAGDAKSIQLTENDYDVYFAEQSMHHFSPLDKILLRIKKFVKPEGLLLINEFVGPDRFQWTDSQIKLSNELLKKIPATHRTYWNSSSVKNKIYKPGRLRMMLNDPSEAVESSQIIPLLNKHFECMELKNYGGTILHPVLDGIAHNFLKDDEETKSILRMCFDYEDNLLASGEIESDFIFAVHKNVK